MNKIRNFFTSSSSKGIDNKLYPSTVPSNRRNKKSSPTITVDESTKEEKVANPQSEKDETSEKTLKENNPIIISKKPSIHNALLSNRKIFKSHFIRVEESIKK